MQNACSKKALQWQCLRTKKKKKNMSARVPGVGSSVRTVLFLFLFFLRTLLVRRAARPRLAARADARRARAERTLRALIQPNLLCHIAQLMTPGLTHTTLHSELERAGHRETEAETDDAERLD